MWFWLCFLKPTDHASQRRTQDRPTYRHVTIMRTLHWSKSGFMGSLLFELFWLGKVVQYFSSNSAGRAGGRVKPPNSHMALFIGHILTDDYEFRKNMQGSKKEKIINSPIMHISNHFNQNIFDSPSKFSSPTPSHPGGGGTQIFLWVCAARVSKSRV